MEEDTILVQTVINIGGNKKKLRYEKIDNINYLVVPMVMLKEGVWNGSQGPGLYEWEDIVDTPILWNHKPVVVTHPQLNGKPVSAADPVILNTRRIGLVLNTQAEVKGKKLKADAWLDIDKTNKVDDRIIKNIKEGKKVEISTGLEVRRVIKEGVFNGVKYSFKATKHGPDHLAVLPDGTGAFSVAEGGGLLANDLGPDDESDDPTPENAAESKEVALETIANAMSYTDLQYQLRNLLAAIYGEPGQWYRGYVCDVYPEYVVFRDSDEREYGQTYSVGKNDVVKLTGKRYPVVRVSEYRRVDNNSVIGNAETSLNKGALSMDKKGKIDKLIANGAFVEADRDLLNGFDYGRVDRLYNAMYKRNDPGDEDTSDGKKKKKVNNEEEIVETVENKGKKPAPTPAPAPAQLSRAESLNKFFLDESYPKDVRDVIRNAVNNMGEECSTLVANIMGHKNNLYKEEELKAKDIGELKKIATMLGVGGTQKQPQVHNYFGGQGAPEMAPKVPQMKPLGLPSTAPAKT